MPTNINDKLISWASEIDPGTLRQAEKAARLPIVEGHAALMPSVPAPPSVRSSRPKAPSSPRP
jgi:hypothetical protein